MAHVEPGDAKEENDKLLSRFVNPSDRDNDDTDDPDYWEDIADEYWDDGEHVDTCPWCGSIFCAHLDNDGQLFCSITKRFIP